MLKLAIFDYDGLLVDSERLAFLAEKKVLADLGKILTKRIFDRYIGYSVADTLEVYIASFKLIISAKDLYTQREKILAGLLKSELKLMPDATSLLDYFQNKKIDMVIASSGERDYIESGLKQLKIIHFFKNITCVSEVKNGKPKPDLFLEALRKNKVKASDAIVFEDSLSGIKAARDARIFCIAVPSQDRNIYDYSQANLIFDNLAKAISFFENNLKISSSQ